MKDILIFEEGTGNKFCSEDCRGVIEMLFENIDKGDYVRCDCGARKIKRSKYGYYKSI